MKTNKKILETLLKIQEIVEAIADNQHRPKGYEYAYNAREEHDDAIAELDKLFVDYFQEKKPFPKYWWTYTEGLPDVIKDWFVENHVIITYWSHEFESVNEVIMFIKGNRSWFGDPSQHPECQYVTHQQIIDHYGLEEKEQLEKTYTKEDIINAWNEYCEAGEFPLFIEWVKENM